MTERSFRAGPWPGLTPAGGGVLVGCALLLAAGQLVIGSPRHAWPDLPMLGVFALAPLVLATRVVQVPGAAAAVCGAYLLPRALVSLLDPSIEPPPLLLVPALAFDASAWIRKSDIAALRDTLPHEGRRWRKRDRSARRIGSLRGALAGAVFGAVLSVIQPPFAVLIGGDPAAWTGPQLWLAAAANIVVCSAVGYAVSARGTGS